MHAVYVVLEKESHDSVVVIQHWRCRISSRAHCVATSTVACLQHLIVCYQIIIIIIIIIIIWVVVFSL